MAWNFHLFSNLVSICCETFRNVSKLGLSHFWVCFNLFQLIYYIQSICFNVSRQKIYGLEFSPFLYNLVSICLEMFRNVSNSDSNFWVCFNLFQLIFYIIYMFQCFETKNIWPGIFTFSPTLFQFVAKRFETFQIWT